MMRKTKSSRLALTLAAILVALLAWFAYATFAMPNIHSHVGDGRFENHSWRFPYDSLGFPVPGYTITFGEHDSGEPFDAVYHIEQLPNIDPKLEVYFCITDPNYSLKSDESRRQLNSTVDIEVFDRGGHSVRHVKEPLAKMIWSDPEGGPNTYGLYNLQQSFFVPMQGERYEIRVKYAPDPKLSEFMGFIYIHCGAMLDLPYGNDQESLGVLA